VRTVVEEPELVKASNEFEAEMAKGETIAFCQSMAGKARQNGDSSEAEVWGFMQVIFGTYRRSASAGTVCCVTARLIIVELVPYLDS